MAKRKIESGGGRLKGQGKTLIWVAVDSSEKQKIRTAAAIEGVPMSQFLKAKGLREAEKLLNKLAR